MKVQPKAAINSYYNFFVTATDRQNKEDRLYRRSGMTPQSFGNGPKDDSYIWISPRRHGKGDYGIANTRIYSWNI